MGIIVNMRKSLAAAAIVASFGASANLADLELEFFGAEEEPDYEGKGLPQINVDDFVEKTFDNLVDHYNMQDDRTYKQRFWINDKYFSSLSTDSMETHSHSTTGAWRTSPTS